MVYELNIHPDYKLYYIVFRMTGQILLNIFELRSEIQVNFDLIAVMKEFCIKYISNVLRIVYSCKTKGIDLYLRKYFYRIQQY